MKPKRSTPVSPPPPDETTIQAPPSALSPRESRAVEKLLTLYRGGWFPMSEDWDDSGARPEVRWVQPHDRGVIPLAPDQFHIPSTLRSTLRNERLAITTDTAFARVIHECAQATKGREATWLDAEITKAFLLLHRAGHAHSIEAWIGQGTQRTLVGGLYGLALGQIFCGESMFSRPALGGSNASKACLVHLVHHLRRRGFAVLDTQLTNPHLAQFGCHAIGREAYDSLLAKHAANPIAWTPFEPDQTRLELSSRHP